MKRLSLALVILFGLAVLANTAPPVVGPPEEAKESAPSKPDASAKEVADLKQQVQAIQERLQQVVDAAKQVSSDEHNARHDHALNQEVKIKILETELAKLRAQQTAKN